jgi:hypothetical protein
MGCVAVHPAGTENYLSKPFTQAPLRAVLETWVSDPRAATPRIARHVIAANRACSRAKPLTDFS